MNEEILAQQLLTLIETRKQEIYKFNQEPSKLTPTEVKMENAFKAGYIKALDDLNAVIIQFKKTF
jgi:hypothetical protein